MDCADCKHAEHAPGHCKQCNCGESYIVRSKATDTYEIPSQVKEGKIYYGRTISRIPPREQR